MTFPDSRTIVVEQGAHFPAWAQDLSTGSVLLVQRPLEAAPVFARRLVRQLSELPKAVPLRIAVNDGAQPDVLIELHALTSSKQSRLPGVRILIEDEPPTRRAGLAPPRKRCGQHSVPS